jgi:hypothetical protein
LVHETHPGRPNYESIASGDAAETIWVLKLNAPVCVRATNEINVSEDSETEIQLVLDQGQYNKYSSLLGQSVTIKGKLFHSHAGHHHKRLLLTTIEIERNA